MFRGFVPITVSLVRELGVNGAYLYGYMWVRRNEEGVFSEGKATMARNLGITKQTILRHVKLLIEKGYIEDESPSGNGTCAYRITGKADFSVVITIRTGYEIIPPGVKKFNPQGSKNLTTGGQNFLPMNHDDMHDEHGTKIDPPLLQQIGDLWENLGFDAGSLGRLLKGYADRPDELLGLLRAWAEAWDDLPDSWGYGLIYRKIQHGETPPAPRRREKTVFEEIMEMTGGEGILETEV